MTPLLHVRPKKGEVCFTVSDVGVDLPPVVGVDAPDLCYMKHLAKYF